MSGIKLMDYDTIDHMVSLRALSKQLIENPEIVTAEDYHDAFTCELVKYFTSSPAWSELRKYGEYQ